uniref:REJ domain-containing protein n=1 Tax=Mesocestoides corti TaxID=53468 RepID=A0A5K3G1B7_MESCO
MSVGHVNNFSSSSSSSSPSQSDLPRCSSMPPHSPLAAYSPAFPPALYLSLYLSLSLSVTEITLRHVTSLSNNYAGSTIAFT